VPDKEAPQCDLLEQQPFVLDKGSAFARLSERYFTGTQLFGLSLVAIYLSDEDTPQPSCREALFCFGCEIAVEVGNCREAKPIQIRCEHDSYGLSTYPVTKLAPTARQTARRPILVLQSHLLVRLPAKWFHSARAT
jgi:hypothetical protein